MMPVMMVEDARMMKLCNPRKVRTMGLSKRFLAVSMFVLIRMTFWTVECVLKETGRVGKKKNTRGDELQFLWHRSQIKKGVHLAKSMTRDARGLLIAVVT